MHIYGVTASLRQHRMVRKDWRRGQVRVKEKQGKQKKTQWEGEYGRRKVKEEGNF